MAAERRTSPEDFLRLIEKAKRGRLKIYVGHAAGVGKTYQMLEDAHSLRKRGVDIVVGYVETHGRTETAEKLEGLPVIPRRRVSYRGKELEEMDLPAILSRKPDIVVVDELAHTNVAGLEHEKRYQDVEEILASGISVMTTVNIQHVESLFDVVTRATGVDVRERVPDRLLRQADAIVNVDLPSEELIQRLKEGKIYPAERITPALQNFFRPENLASLRELAMRSIADRLEAERRASVEKEAGTIGTKVLVAISANPATTRQLLRRGSSIAGRLNTNWYAAYVRTPQEHPNRMSARDHRLLAENVTLAMELGAKVVWLVGKNVARELFRFASENGVTLAIFGKSRRSWSKRTFARSPIDAFVRVGSGIDVFEIETE
ncbi:MAG TPA: histidine kinase, partial [Thermoanaerobaculia bacterium]|nr:histidine kinase [Thermoanaerobaculia bacterium]